MPTTHILLKHLVCEMMKIELLTSTKYNCVVPFIIVFNTVVEFGAI